MIGRAFRDARGVAAIEFAITLPFLALLFVGGYQYSDAISFYRKMTRASRTLADLTAQNTSLSPTDVTAIMSTSTQVMVPFPATGAQITISQLVVDGNGAATVDWSQAQNTSPLSVGSSYTLPANVATSVKNGYLIVATVKMTYAPGFVSNMVGTIPLADTAMMIPRASASVRMM